MRIVLQFGFGKNEGVEEVLDPSNILTKTHGKNYITDDSFDPASLIKTDSLGISPNNTLLTIVYRINDSTATNTGIGTITSVVDPIFSFESQTSLNASSVSSVRNSLEVINEEPFVGGDALPTSDELKQRAYGVYSMQNRIVTKEDFITAAYNMPPSFGSIKKVNVYQDSDSFNQRNINLFVLSL